MYLNFLNAPVTSTCQRPETAEGLKICECHRYFRFMIGILVDVRPGSMELFCVGLVGVGLYRQGLLHTENQ